MTYLRSGLILFGAVTGALAGASGLAWAQPTQAEAGCIQVLDKSLSKLAKTQGKTVAKCAKDYAKSKTIETGTVAGCITADDKGKLGKLLAKTAIDFGKNCVSLPPYGPNDRRVVDEAGVVRTIELAYDTLGTDLDAVLRQEDPDKADSQCQQAVLKTALKCRDKLLKSFEKCAKDALKGDTPPATAGEFRDACLGQNGTAAGIPDPKGKLDKACGTALEDKAFAKKCFGLDTSSLLVPQSSADADALVRCSTCRMLNRAANLDRDCDEFDNGASDASCPEENEAEVVCSSPASLPSGTCEAAVAGSQTLLVGDVLAPERIYRGGQVLVDDDGTLACVGCFCDALAPGASIVNCPDGVVSPGLINTHEHLTFAQNQPYTDTGERYEHRHHWRLGLGGHTAIPSAGGASTSERRWGELRHLLAGMTSMAGAGSAPGLVRNLDVGSHQQGLGQAEVAMDTFPLGDAGGELLASGCAYPSITTTAEISFEEAYLPHVAEGIDENASNEFVCQASGAGGGQDLVQPQSAFTHLVALTAAEYEEMELDGTKLIWSPRSNITLYGDTARVSAAARSGVTIALGTDWIVTGSMNMLRELRCADSFSQDYLDGFFSDEELWEMATLNAAVVSATDDVIGSLETGKIADLAVFDASTSTDHRALIDADPEDVVLVMRGGKVLYGDAAPVSVLRGAGTCDSLDVCGTAKEVCLQDEIGQDLATLEAAVAGIYPAFFCGTPTDEPTCTPARTVSVSGSTIYDGIPTLSDPDGDGVEIGDSCPDVFNPVRPMDGGVQADSDSDGTGDACDECPNSIVCP